MEATTKKLAAAVAFSLNGTARRGFTRKKLLDHVRDAIRLKYYSICTEQVYVNSIKCSHRGGLTVRSLLD